MGSDVVGSVKDKSGVGLGPIGGGKDERSDLLSSSSVGHGAGNVDVARCASHTNVSLGVGDDGDIVIVTSTISAVPVSSSVMTMSMSVSVMTIMIVRSLVEGGELLDLDLASGNDPDSISGMARLDVNGSTVSVPVAVVVNDSIGILSVIINHVDLGRMSLVVVSSSVLIDDNGITMSAGVDNSSIVSASLDDSGIVSVNSSLDDSGLVMVASRKERLDFFHNR